MPSSTTSVASPLAIQASGLGKQYRVGAKSIRQRKMIRDALKTGLRRVAQRGRELLTGAVPGAGTDTFWALKDVSFDVRAGDTLGVIGRNGAGKSTLLKLLSRITDPTEGEATLHGRVGALLEVGTGFHGELTGRENIYLSGAILGMGRREMHAKFDEIVEFANVAQFIDTPVKRYSSGMNVRLGFAVAAHLDPETLIIDEVLAVGDADFQRKCINKMADVASQGRTVIVVSHNMDLVRRLTTSAILLESGRLVEAGATEDVVNSYIRRVESAATTAALPQDRVRRRTRLAAVRGFEMTVPGENPSSAFSMGDSVEFSAEIELSGEFPKGLVSIEISSFEGQPIFQFTNVDGGLELPDQPGRYAAKATIDCLRLYPGLYNVRVAIYDHVGTVHSRIDPVATIEVLPGDYPKHWRNFRSDRGTVYEESSWTASEVSIKGDGSGP